MSLWCWTKRSVLLLCAGRSLRKTLETTRSPWKRLYRWWEEDLRVVFLTIKSISPFLHPVEMNRSLVVEIPPCASVCRCQAMEDCKTEPFETHSALEIAEQLTLLDHLVFKVIPYAWVHTCVYKHRRSHECLSVIHCWWLGKTCFFSSLQGVLWSRLDEEWQERENPVHHENHQAFQQCT